MTTEKSKADARALWALAVLDAQAKRYESSTLTPAYVGVTSKVDGSRLVFWRISATGIRALQADCQGMFPTADAARMAAALVIYPDLPEAVRRELGECPGGC